MNLGLLLVIIGLAVAMLVYWGLGVLLIVIGVVLLIAPEVRRP